MLMLPWEQFRGSFSAWGETFPDVLHESFVCNKPLVNISSSLILLRFKSNILSFLPLCFWVCFLQPGQLSCQGGHFMLVFMWDGNGSEVEWTKNMNYDYMSLYLLQTHLKCFNNKKKKAFSEYFWTWMGLLLKKHTLFLSTSSMSLWTI